MQFLSSVTQLLSDLVAINSINPDLVPGGAGEGAVGHLVAQWLSDHGLQVQVQPVQPGRNNIIGIEIGRASCRERVLQVV